MCDIEMCSECYDRANETPDEYFINICNPPHLLVWCRMPRFPYWPAKIIGMAPLSSDKIEVRFFGSHERSNVSLAGCTLFSDNPNKNLTNEQSYTLAESLKASIDF